MGVTFLEAQARTRLPKDVFEFYAGGAETECTLRDNCEAFKRYKLLPSLSARSFQVDLTTHLLGHRLSFPILIAPTALQCLAHPDGELATAHAAMQCGTAMVVSSNATHSAAEVAAMGNPLLIFQLYVFRNRAAVRGLVQEVERCGYKALAVTVDVPRPGNREADTRNAFAVPAHLRVKNMDWVTQQQQEPTASPSSGTEQASLPDGQTHTAEVADQAAPYQNMHSSVYDQGLTWEFIPWLRTITGLPIFVKGILSPLDARLALEQGVDGIMVSNHGGRQCDYAPAPIDMLPAITAAVGRRVPVIVDGGIRSGADVLKALALGADAVMIGRPVLYGLAVAGQAGVEWVLRTLSSELQEAMMQAGCADLKQVSRSLVVRTSAARQAFRTYDSDVMAARSSL